MPQNAYRSNEAVRNGEPIQASQHYLVLQSDNLPIDEANIQGSSGNGPAQEQQTSKLYFDTFCDFTLFRNTTNIKDLYQSESDREQIYLEKFAILLELIDMMAFDHKSLFKRLIMRNEFKETLERIFCQERL